jgi:hypothetical protein
VADWATISSLATAGGTLVLAVATFASVRSAGRAARAAERSLQVGLRPLLMPSQPQDPSQKIVFIDHYVHTLGGGAVAEVTEEVIYLAISLRNAGSGIAVLHGWVHHSDRVIDGHHPDVGVFRRLGRDIYVPPGALGFWQGALRDPAEEAFTTARDGITERRPMTVDLLYGDHEGGQRTVSRFLVLPTQSETWIASVSRHWSLDRPDPRPEEGERGRRHRRRH